MCEKLCWKCGDHPGPEFRKIERENVKMREAVNLALDYIRCPGDYMTGTVEDTLKESLKYLEKIK